MASTMNPLGGGPIEAAPGRSRAKARMYVPWTDAEERLCYDGFLKYVVEWQLPVKEATQYVVQWFAGTIYRSRKLRSIELKLWNHMWFHTNGSRGLSNANAWGWEIWRTRKTPEEMQMLEELRAREKAERKVR